MRRSELVTPHGTAAIVELDDHEIDAALAVLPDEEQRAAEKLSGVRRRELVAGRTAMHCLIAEAVLSNERGAPILPAGKSGSISHKLTRAAALVADAHHGHVGIDLERTAATRLDIGKRILTVNEPKVQGAELLRVFAIKEAIYKAIDPIVRRYVGFQEVELVVGEGGEVGVTIVDPVKLPVIVEAWWTRVDDHWLATARGRKL
ncbi:MAG: 4'-phosphopantetheinyl transferase superfamily protein [Kofleriaceae bacterium]